MDIRDVKIGDWISYNGVHTYKVTEKENRLIRMVDWDKSHWHVSYTDAENNAWRLATNEEKLLWVLRLER